MTRRKPVFYRDQCLGLDVVALARGGFTRPGLHNGTVELLGEGDGFGAVVLPIRSFFGPDGGDLHVDRPLAERIPVRPVETPIGRRWKLLCRPCGALVRTLWVPELPLTVEPPPVWACRHCWRIGYRRRGRRGRIASARERLAMVRRTRAELGRIEEAILFEIAWERAGGRADDAGAGPMS